MDLDSFCATFQSDRFPKAHETTAPDLPTILDLRRWVEAAVVDDAFLLQCIQSELGAIRSNRVRRGLDCFRVVPEYGMRLALGFWEPGAGPGPHEHTAWTVTAVCRNWLNVATYDRAATYARRELVAKNLFTASAGRAGYIYEACIHSPWNPTGDVSMTFHVMSPWDGRLPSQLDAVLGDADVERSPCEHPYDSVLTARRNRRTLGAIVELLGGFVAGPSRQALVDACYSLASIEMRQAMRSQWNALLPPEAEEASLKSTFVRTHPELELGMCFDGQVASLNATTAHGISRELELSNDRDALDVIAHLAQAQSFDLDTLPGGLSPAECLAVANALEQSGLFRRLS